MVDRQTIENQIDEFVKDNFPSDFKFREYQKEKIIDIVYNIVGECDINNFRGNYTPQIKIQGVIGV